MKDSAIGRSIPRIEGSAKVTGACVYSADVLRPDALWAGFVRSPVAHARILNIDAKRALKLRQVKAFVAGRDVPAALHGCTLIDKPVFAQERVRYIGEKVAGIAATDRDALEEALDLVRVEYEELPAVFDPLEAMKPEAPILHPDYAAYDGINLNKEGLKNVRSIERSNKGDIERGFAESDEIFENTFHTQIVHQAFLEPRAGVVEIDAQGRVAIRQCHQAPFAVRKTIATHADIPEEMIVVHPVSTGGSFGGKIDFEDVLCTYYLARAVGGTVKYVERYSEEFTDGQPRHAATVILRTGVKKDGRIWAWDGKIFYNGGAYGARTPRNGMNGTLLLAGTYRTPHVRMQGYVVYTNQPPSGYFRAPGEPQTLFAAESQMDMMAEALGLDPLEFRLRNCLREGDTKPNGDPLVDPCGLEVLERIGAVSNWRKTRPRAGANQGRFLKGKGIGFGFRHIGVGESSAQIFLEPDGTLRLVTGVRDVGVGAYTMHRQVTAQVIEIDPELVSIDPAGTDRATYDEGVRGQRGTHVEGQAVLKAATALVEALKNEAAKLWRVEAGRVEWKRGSARLKDSKERLSLKQLAELSKSPVSGFGEHTRGERPHVYVFQAMVADVEVDRETGEVEIKQLYYVSDATKIINPIIYTGLIHGGIVQGLGFTRMEDLAVEEGRVTTLNFGDYKIPNIRDLPSLKLSRVQANEGPGPFGAKSVAESGIGIVAPAVANAIHNATGVRITRLPVACEEILAGLKRKAS